MTELIIVYWIPQCMPMFPSFNVYAFPYMKEPMETVLAHI